MVIFLFLGVVLAGTAVALFARSLAFGHVRRREMLAQISAYGFSGPVVRAVDRPGLRQLADRGAEALGKLAMQRLGAEHERKLRNLLRAAGYYRTEPALFLGYRVGGALLLPLLWIVLAVSAGAVGFKAILAVCVVGGLAWVLPGFLLARRATGRLQRIDHEMPELVDLLVTTVEAGVGFAGSLQMVARRVEGPLGEELRLALQEQNMGMTIESALQHMLERVDSVAMRAFVQAVLQGQTLGASIGKVLRDLAVDMRQRRRHYAEERANKAPTKLLFPLIFLILPALLIVSLGGPLIGLVRQLGSM
jgi:tight adherence protein C